MAIERLGRNVQGFQLARPHGKFVGKLLLLTILVAGCNTSRYGTRYDERFPQIRRVGILPAETTVRSRHSGGALEPRTDLQPAVQARVVAVMKEFVRARGCEPFVLSGPQPGAGDADVSRAHRYALLSAVRDAIVDHHYEFGRALFFEYPTGDALRVLGADHTDAVLLVYVHAIVPTAGREALKGTAVAMGVLTGVRFHISTSETAVYLMLVDARSGEVLWFNRDVSEDSVESEWSFRLLLKRAAAYLLKPRR